MVGRGSLRLAACRGGSRATPRSRSATQRSRPLAGGRAAWATGRGVSAEQVSAARRLHEPHEAASLVRLSGVCLTNSGEGGGCLGTAGKWPLSGRGGRLRHRVVRCAVHPRWLPEGGRVAGQGRAALAPTGRPAARPRTRRPACRPRSPRSAPPPHSAGARGFFLGPGGVVWCHPTTLGWGAW